MDGCFTFKVAFICYFVIVTINNFKIFGYKRAVCHMIGSWNFFQLPCW